MSSGKACKRQIMSTEEKMSYSFINNVLELKTYTYWD